MLVTKWSPNGPTDFYSRQKKLDMGVSGTQHCLITNILQNIFCVPQKKETHTGLELNEGE